MSWWPPPACRDCSRRWSSACKSSRRFSKRFTLTARLPYRFSFRSRSSSRPGRKATRRMAAAVYVIVDGRLSEQPAAIRLRTRSILSRSVSAGLNHMLRTTLELTATDAELEGAQFQFAAIPVAYPQLRPVRLPHGDHAIAVPIRLPTALKRVACGPLHEASDATPQTAMAPARSSPSNVPPMMNSSAAWLCAEIPFFVQEYTNARKTKSPAAIAARGELQRKHLPEQSSGWAIAICSRGP